uniref:Uncharacterized protein n=1 Tax=Schizaphis graminum TaxID=13262 RepID=A0A2S2PI77_SCHGA
MASQQHRLAKLPAPESSPEANTEPPTEPTPVEAMEVDVTATKGETPNVPTTSTVPEQLSQAADSELSSEDAWLAAPGPSLDGLPEIIYDKPFFTPDESRDRS